MKGVIQQVTGMITDVNLIWTLEVFDFFTNLLGDL